MATLFRSRTSYILNGLRNQLVRPSEVLLVQWKLRTDENDLTTGCAMNDGEPKTLATVPDKMTMRTRRILKSGLDASSPTNLGTFLRKSLRNRDAL